MVKAKGKKVKQVKKIKRSMTKADLVRAVIADSKADDVISKAQIGRIVDSVFDNIVKIVDDNDKLFIYQFGTFRKSTQKARAYTTPSGDIVDKPDCSKFAFKASSVVNQQFNN